MIQTFSLIDSSTSVYVDSQREIGCFPFVDPGSGVLTPDLCPLSYFDLGTFAQ